MLEIRRRRFVVKEMGIVTLDVGIITLATRVYQGAIQPAKLTVTELQVCLIDRFVFVILF